MSGHMLNAQLHLSVSCDNGFTGNVFQWVFVCVWVCVCVCVCVGVCVCMCVCFWLWVCINERERREDLELHSCGCEGKMSWSTTGLNWKPISPNLDRTCRHLILLPHTQHTLSSFCLFLSFILSLSSLTFLLSF